MAEPSGRSPWGQRLPPKVPSGQKPPLVMNIGEARSSGTPSAAILGGEIAAPIEKRPRRQSTNFVTYRAPLLNVWVVQPFGLTIHRWLGCIAQESLRREQFFEKRKGTCYLNPPGSYSVGQCPSQALVPNSSAPKELEGRFRPRYLSEPVKAPTIADRKTRPVKDRNFE